MAEENKLQILKNIREELSVYRDLGKGVSDGFVALAQWSSISGRDESYSKLIKSLEQDIIRCSPDEICNEDEVREDYRQLLVYYDEKISSLNQTLNFGIVITVISAILGFFFPIIFFVTIFAFLISLNIKKEINKL